MNDQQEAGPDFAPQERESSESGDQGEQMNHCHRLRTGQAHVHEPVGNMIVIADVDRLAVVKTDQHNRERIKKRDRKDEQRDQQSEFRRGDSGGVISDFGADHRQQVAEQMASGIAHED